MNTPHDILKQYWHYDAFRPMQEDIINAVLEGNDTLALLPTGGGKSICFQVPAMVLSGMCLVITPLIALMKDQVDNLKSKGIPAAYLDGSMGWREIQFLLDNASSGAYKFLYISPERLKSEVFRERLKNFKLACLVVDEAHCISQWGYDFRPAYLEIAEIRVLIGKTPIIALTATATEVVKKDICEKLLFINPKIFQKSFARANLSYSAFCEEDKLKKTLNIIQNVQGSAIVYVRSRKKTKEVAAMLYKNGIKADYYHAGLGYAERSEKQVNWIKNKVRVIVATNAFGMGIDKPDVRVVVHLDVPESPEAYYQEAGRAGRDEQKAYAIAIYNNQDIKELRERLGVKYPEIAYIKKVYQALANYLQVASGTTDGQSHDLVHDVFCKKYGFEIQPTFYALQQLAQQGFISLNEDFYSSARLFVPDNKELYKFQIENAKFDIFIKALLRIYGGNLYHDFVKISLSNLSSRLKLPSETIDNILIQLHNTGVIIYEKQKDKPQVSFFQERYHTENIPFDHKIYRERRLREEQKIEAMIKYVENGSRCRTKILLEYFGELLDEDCGVCDHCIQKKKELKSEALRKDMIEKILTELKIKAYLPEELMKTVLLNDKELFTWAVKYLLDRQEIRYDQTGRLIVVSC